MAEAAFGVPVDGGMLRGHRAGSGVPALLLHGGAAVPDYLAECAVVLDGLFATIRYTQRGTPPSEGRAPYSIESHVADAVAVLDSFGIERAWAIGHSWGGHLALHLALAHPQRLLGLLLIGPLGADPGVFPEQDANLRRGLTEPQRARIDDIEKRRRAGEVTEAELIERFALIWPQFFASLRSHRPPVSASRRRSRRIVRSPRTSSAGRSPTVWSASGCRPCSSTASTIQCRCARPPVPPP